MKINKIQNNVNSKVTFIKPKSISTQSTKEIEQNISVKNAPNNPKYYQTLNHVNFKGGFISLSTKDQYGNKGLKIRIPISQEDKVTLELNKNDSCELFFDEEGNLDTKTLAFFAKYYADFYNVKKEMHEKEKDVLLKIINDNKNSKLRAINPSEDVFDAFISCEEHQTGSYGETLLNSIMDGETLLNSIMDGETKKNLAIRRLNRIDNEFKTYSITLAKELITILKLSKQKDGSIDESNFKEKLNIAVLLTFYNKEVSKDCTDYIFKLSKNEKGEVDLEFCHLLIEMLIYCTIGENLQKEIQECADTISKHKKANPDTYKDKIEEIILKHQIGDINPYFNN